MFKVFKVKLIFLINKIKSVPKKVNESLIKYNLQKNCIL